MALNTVVTVIYFIDIRIAERALQMHSVYIIRFMLFNTKRKTRNEIRENIVT